MNQSNLNKSISNSVYTIKQIANILGISMQELENKLECIEDFTSDEINQLVDILSITYPTNFFYT